MERDAAIEITVGASLPGVHLLAATCRAVLGEWGVPADRRTLLELALVEAATNAVVHAYRDLPPGPVTVRLARAGSTLTLSVGDRGRAFDPASVRPSSEPTPSDPSSWPEGGMGLGIIRAAADSVEYESANGENRLIIRASVPEIAPAGH